MSGIAYPPPTEILPIFDNSVFNVNQNVALTEAQANLLYLKFPTAQGAETFGDIFVNANATLNCPVQVNSNLLQLTGTSSIQFPDLSIQTSAYTGTAGVASSVVVAPGGSGAMYLALTQGTSGNYPILTNTPQYNATTGVLSSAQFTGALNGNATTSTSATQITISPNGNNATHYLTFSDSNTAGNINLHTNSGILVNPSTDTITATTFSGDLSGNATTATTATNATNIALTSDNTSGTYYIPFSKTISATSNALYVDNTTGPLSYNPSTSLLACSGFSGVTVSASTSVSSLSLNATNGGNIKINDVSGTYQTVITQPNYNYNVSMPTGASMNIFNNGGTCPLPTLSASFGMSIGNNISGGRDESCLFNYQGNSSSGTAGGFDFYNISSTTNAVKIAGIPKTQSAFSSTGLNIPTYDWVNGTISAGISAITQVPITNTTSSINYFLPLVTNTTTGSKTLFAGGSIAFNPAINTLSTTNFSASGNMQAPIIQTTANGVIRAYDTGGVLATSLQQIGTDLNIIIPATGEMKITTQGTGVIPTLNPDAGTSFLWNVSAGGGESCIVNYQDGGSAGGFDFYNVNGVANSVKIATIPKTQSAFSTASSTILSTYDWVNGTVSAAISAIPSLTSFNMTVIPPAASNTYYGLWANSAVTGSHPINNGSYVQLVPNTNTMTITSNLNILNTQTSLNNARFTSTPIILAFGNNDGSAGGGADATNLTSSYISSTGWTNPSGGLYTITLTGVAHSIFSATITGNPNTATAGQRPQILTSVAYAGGLPNAYLSATFQIYYLQGTGGGGAPFNGAFSYSISGIMN